MPMRSLVIAAAVCGVSALHADLPLAPLHRCTPVTRAGGVVAELASASLPKAPLGYGADQPREPDGWLANAAAACASESPGVLAAVRDSAAAKLPAIFFPARKDEPWRRFDLSSLRGATLTAPSANDATMLAESLARCVDDESAGMRLVLVDGRCSAELSDLSALPEGVSAGSLCDASGTALEGALAELGGELPEAGADPNTVLGVLPFAALNQASLMDVASVHVAKGVAVERPLHVIMLSTGPGADADADALPASHPNLVVSLEEDSQLTLSQHYFHCGQGDSYFCNALTRVTLGERASLDHSYVQEQSAAAIHIDSVLVESLAGASYASTMLQSGARLSRVNHRVSLSGPEATSDLRALSMATDNQLSDIHSRVIHASGHCTSRQEQRNAVAGRSRVVWKGAVVVPPGSDFTDAKQLCRTLLLSDDARVDVQPTLEIDTDEVECTHGATVSDLDDEMVFYLQARGLSRPDARALLLAGWARDALSQVPNEGVKARATAVAANLSPEKTVRRDRNAFQSI